MNNPIYQREVMVRSRNFRIPLAVLAFNGLLAAVAMFNLCQTVGRARQDASIQYSSFLNLYVFVTTLEFLLLMCIMPAMTSASISGERERRTLDLLFTTELTASQIVAGKMAAALSQLFLLILSSFPVIVLTFVYGSMDFQSLGLLFACYLVTALLTGGIGIFSSAFMRRSTMSNVCTYGILLALVVGTYLLNSFLLNQSQTAINALRLAAGEMRPAADSGAAVYLLLLNPAMTFLKILESQVSGGAGQFTMNDFLGGRPENFVTRNWIAVSLGIQLLLCAAFLWGAARLLGPRYRERE